MTTDIMAAINAAAKATAQTAPDLTKPQTGGGGGGGKPMATGPAFARFVNYVEVGEHTRSWKDKKTGKTITQTENLARLDFELFGKNFPPSEDGEPQRIGVDIKISRNEKAHYIRVFNAMNLDGQATHFAQLLGNAYKLNIVGREDKVREYEDELEDGTKVKKKWTWAELYDKANGTWGISAAVRQVPDPADETGLTMITQPVPVPKMVGTPKLFLWDAPSKALWDNLFIEGEYPERKDDKGNVIMAAKTKNVFQERIMAADNYAGSPINDLLGGGDDALANVLADSEPPAPERDPADAAAAEEVRQAAQQGVALDTPPFDVDPLADLDDIPH